jgi:radical SAM-linked protein
MKAQRLRVTFSRGDDMKYVTHLDMMRFWERALRRAQIPVTYSEGFSPHPQIAIAAPLAVGTTSDCEIMDVFLDEHMTPGVFIEALAKQVPPAIGITAAREVGLALPSLQADVRAAEYEVDAPAQPRLDVGAAVYELLAAESIPWEHMREDETKSYDLRPLVIELAVVAREEATTRLRMMLRNDSTAGAGRPEQVALALGLEAPTRIHRTRLVLAERSPAREAYRKAGRYAV